MRKTIKALVLGCMTVGVLAGCNWGKTSSEQSDNRSSAFTSTSSIPDSVSDSSVSTSSITSSSTTTSIPSSSTTSSSTSTSVAPTLTGIVLNTNNVKKDYLHGDALDLTGLVVTAQYSDNTTVNVNDYTTNPANGTALNTVGAVKVTVSYSTFTADFNVTVSAKLTGIAINTDNVKKEYEQGEALDLTGLVVTAQYSDNTTANVTDYTTNPANGTVFNEIKEETITVTYGEFSKTFKVNVVKATKKAWTAEEAKIMSDHLNGQVLPFTGFEESVVSYDSTEDMVLIQGGAKEEGYVAKYAAKLAALGYEEYFQNANSAGYEKEFTTANGLRHVYVYIGFDQDQLMIQAYDPYVYSFPTSFATEVADKYFESTKVVPAIAADYYLVDADYLSIRCYLTATTDDAGYSAILSAANWSVQPEKDDQNYYIAISPDQKYAAAYAYMSGALRIYLEPIGFWNSNLINEFFTKYGGEPVNIPALNVEGAQYQFSEWSNNELAYQYGAYEYIHAYMAIYGSKQADLGRYETILKEAGWEVINSDGFYTATLEIANKGIARIEFSFNTQINGVLITIYFKLDPIPEKDFPAAKIAELLGEDITDVVPAYTGANKGFTILDDEAGTAVMVYVEGGTESDAVAAYKAILTEAKYTEAGVDAQGDMRYISEHGQILVTPYYGTSGSITIAFKAAPLLAWPAAQIVNAFPTATDTVPAVDGALEYMFQKSGRMVNIACTFKTGDEAKAALATFIGALEEAKFELLGVDDGGDPHYNSLNDNFEVRPYVSNATLYVTIMGPEEVESLWPLDKLTEWFGEDIAKAIPVYDKGSEYKFYETTEFKEIMVTVEDADVAVEEYAEILTTAGFTTTYKDEFDDTHYCKGNIDITPWAEDDTVMDIDIVINEISVSKWPTQTIANLFATAGYTDALPSYDGECDAIEAGTNYDGSIYVLIETSDDDAVFDAYDNLLEANHFVYDSIYSTSTTYIYKSPNNQYTVSLTTNRFGVEIDIKKIDNGGGQTGSNEFPMDDIVSSFPTASGVLPAIEDEGATFTVDVPYDGEVSVVVKFATEQEATNALNAYISALTTAKFTYEEGVWSYLDVYVSPDRAFMIEITPNLSNGSFELYFMDTYGSI